MNNYSKALEFFIENNIILSEDQLESLQELFKDFQLKKKEDINKKKKNQLKNNKDIDEDEFTKSLLQKNQKMLQSAGY